MCGILGIIDFTTPQRWETARFKQALNKMRHRGPDDEGIFISPYFILGHRRLSILDLDPRSKQPMLTEDGRFIIVFNGEIYNFKTLRKILLAKNISFSTQGDTEVLLKGFRHFGHSFIEKCIGMFACCFIDTEKKTAYLYRDRLGIKPLYYAKINNRFYFSSSVGSLYDLMPKALSVNELSLVSYLAFRYPLENHTFINNIHQLTPGHKITLTPETKTIQAIEYWNPVANLDAQKEDLGEKYYRDQLLDLLQNAVNYRLIADVPVGAYLSGGVDSSGLVGLMRKHQPDQQINTYSIGFQEVGFNEFSYAKQVAKQFSTTHHEITQNDADYYQLMQQLIVLKGAPLAVPNEVSIWQLSKILKKEITVVLSGEGADELFWGYGRLFRSPYDYQRLQNKFPWPNQKLKAQFFANYQKQYSNSLFDNPLAHFLSQYSYTSAHNIQSILTKDIDVNKHYSTLTGYFEHYFKRCKNTEYGNKISYAMIKLHLPGLLQRLDNATMAASVEGRVPFVDHRLVEFSMTIPTQYKLPWKSNDDKNTALNHLAKNISEKLDTPKAILKKAFHPMLPDNILYRKKMGFPVPLANWANNKFHTIYKDTLLDENACCRNIFDRKTLKSMISKQHKDNNAHHAMTLWMLLNIELFLKSLKN